MLHTSPVVQDGRLFRRHREKKRPLIFSHTAILRGRDLFGLQLVRPECTRRHERPSAAETSGLRLPTRAAFGRRHERPSAADTSGLRPPPCAVFTMSAPCDGGAVVDACCRDTPCVSNTYRKLAVSSLVWLAARLSHAPLGLSCSLRRLPAFEAETDLEPS